MRENMEESATMPLTFRGLIERVSELWTPPRGWPETNRKRGTKAEIVRVLEQGELAGYPDIGGIGDRHTGDTASSWRLCLATASAEEVSTIAANLSDYEKLFRTLEAGQ